MAETLLSSERMLLRELTPAHIHEVIGGRSQEEAMRYFGLPGEEDYAHYRSLHEGGMETDRLSLRYFLLVLKESGEVIGECGFHTWNARHRRAELFYLLRKEEHKNRGFMREALPLVLDHGFYRMELNRVAALVDRGNEPSLRLLRRFGFVLEGTMREDYVVNGLSEDSDCYSLLKREWQGTSSR